MKNLFIIFILSFSLILSLNSVSAQMLLKGGVVRDNGKIITPFYYNGVQIGYGIQYDDDLYHNFYYDLYGTLTQYDVLDKPRTEFPHNTVSYDATGEIISKSISFSKTQQVVYTPDGKLKARWDGDNCYDANGNKLTSSRALPH